MAEAENEEAAVTPTPSLSERLREFSVSVYNPDGLQGRIHPPICTEAADALDAKDEEIKRLKEAHLKLAFAEHDIPWPDALDGHIRRKLRSP